MDTMSEFATLTEENFITCDSPSGSSTSEPHEDILGAFSPFFQKNNERLDSTFISHNQSPISQNAAFSPEFAESLLSNGSPMIEPNFWPDYSNVIPELAKNFTSQMNEYQEPTTTSLPGMQIRVLGVPQTGAKSRVETQIKLCIQLVTDDGDKAQRWSHLKLPGDMVAKEKLKRPVVISNNGATIASLDNTTLLPESMLYLTAKVICASDPSRKVTICSGCIQREHKRSQRRKDKKVDTNEFGLEEEATEQKVLLFNCSEVVDFSSGDAILPTRITCYCRHHNERLGFCIYFEMSDHQGQKVASGMSPPIMITDDHKSNKAKPNRKRPRIDSDVPQLSLNPKQNNHHQIQPRPTHSTEPPLFSSERPLLQRLIPNEGPTFGGIEVTLLGSNLRAGLTCMFGDVAASSTHFWSPNTLVCVLPPAAVAGTVVVSFKEYPMVMEEVTLFTYYNENDRALMELALQVVGLKMTGKVEDAREIAMRIVQGGDSSSNPPSSNNLEHHVMRVLDVMTTLCHVKREDVSITSAPGHSMLHLAAMLGFHLLTKRLIDMGCDGNIMDHNGYTALHYAAWYRHTEVVRLLLEDANVDREITNKWDKKPLDLAEDTIVQQLILNSPDYGSDDLSSNESIWQGDIEESDATEEVLSDSDVSVSSDESDPHPVIQYLNKTDVVSYTHEDIVDAQPFEDILESPTDDEKEAPKDMSWMQRTLSHFQPTTASHDLLQNIKNTIPAKPTELNFKNIADHVLQFPSRPASMVSGLFSTKTNEQEDPPAETLAWYMALAYAMGAKGLLSEDEKEESVSSARQEECTVSKKKERDRMLYSFWVPMLCVMIVWLVFQIVSSNPGVTDTIISLSGIRRQYLTVH
ncbi:hypothetical protein BY458DRAFT_167556 [Sporodiniella umbellata]|nr:hypothetical protein BY458DRAFT_167556 [Sporodiniella umbellata]